MKTITPDTVVSEVRINLDEALRNEADFSLGSDDDELDEIIKQKMGEAYRYVLANAKAESIDAALVETAEVPQVEGTTTSKVFLTDFLRFVWGNANEWCHPVYAPVMWNSPEYATLCDPHTTGTRERPKASVRPALSKEAKTTAVTLYGTSNGGIVGYIKEVSGEEEGLQLTETLYTAYLYYISALVLLTLKDSQHAEEMMGQALALMGLDVSNKAQ